MMLTWRVRYSCSVKCSYHNIHETTQHYAHLQWNSWKANSCAIHTSVTLNASPTQGECVCVCVRLPSVNLKQLALSITFISPKISNNIRITADRNTHFSHNRLEQILPHGLRPLTRCQKGAITTLSIAISSVASAMWPRRKIKQSIHFSSQIIHLE
jgi:hypothetical protein